MSDSPKSTSSRRRATGATERIEAASLNLDSQPTCLLYVTAGDPHDVGRSLRLVDGKAVVGTDADCDLVLADGSVSRKHAEITIDRQGILVTDLGSTNGTTFLGQRIERAALTMGARLCLGRCTIDILPDVAGESMPVSGRDSYGLLVGYSVAMRRLYTVLEQLERSDVPVLIEGETGTGKELVARALHTEGLRKAGAFVTIDCATVPVELMESEFFGHRKGSFTGATGERQGAFESAAGGTAFLDEIGEMPLALQPKLLRVLESGEVRRVGESLYKTVDVRIVAATNRSLREEVKRGRFREDLYYRLAVVQVRTPPLRQRRDDIALLCEHLTKSIAKSSGTTLPAHIVQFFVGHDWPGNVRELRNAVQKYLAIGDAGIRPLASDRPTATLPLRKADGSMQNFHDAREELSEAFEKRYLLELWKCCAGNLSEAARQSGVSRRHLRQLLRKHNMYEG